jgi:hypothetical protein
MTHVPFSFRVPDGGEVTDLLETIERDGLVTVRWRDLGLSLVHAVPAHPWGSPDIGEVAAHTPGFRAHGLHGFTLDGYTEVLALEDRGYRQGPAALVHIGNVEVTLAEPTPLLRYLLQRHYDDDYHGEWETISSMRVWQCPPERAEAHLIEAHAALTKAGRYFDLISFDLTYPDYDEEEEQPKLVELKLPSAVTDIEPLRLYHRGLTQSDAATAILQFYRVLEYYSVVSRHTEVDALRRRADLNSRDFTVQVARLVGDEDRASICRLLAMIADGALLQRAVNLKLIEKATSHELGNKLYDLRNTLVHAKHDHRTPMFVPSIFADVPELVGWRVSVEELARAALDKLGTRAL